MKKLHSVSRLHLLIYLITTLATYELWAGRYVHAQVEVVSPDEVSIPSSESWMIPTVTPTPVKSAASGHDSTTIGYGLDYVVQEGDTLWSVALEVGLDTDVMPCIIDPEFQPGLPLVIGNQLSVPALEFACHEVLPGETLASIATLYGVDPGKLTTDVWNGLEAYADPNIPFPPGRYVRILAGENADAETSLFGYLLGQPIDEGPIVAYAMGGPVREEVHATVPANWPYGSGYFEWPAYGWITQSYRYDHRAVDIAAQKGTFITAADRGEVVRAGWNNQGYGMFVIIDHNIDYITLYAHLEDILVEEGDIVAKGQVIGTVGSTGNSTGPHLHFEVRDFGSRINPLKVLVR